MPPRKSADVAIKLYDRAKALGIPARINCSLVKHSDSRYVVLFPGEVGETTIRISSHKVHPDQKFALCLSMFGGDALEIGLEWIERTFSDDETIARLRQTPPPEHTHYTRRGPHRHLVSGDVHPVTGEKLRGRMQRSPRAGAHSWRELIDEDR